MYNVLIVDDEVQAIEYILSLISWESNGFKIVAEAHSAFQAMSMLETLNIDLVILDVSMPECNGVDLSRMIKEKHSDIKMIAISSFDNYDYVRQILKNGADDYILKHRLNSEILLNALNHAINKTQIQTSTFEQTEEIVKPQLSLSSTEEKNIQYDIKGQNWVGLQSLLEEIFSKKESNFIYSRLMIAKDLFEIIYSENENKSLEEAFVQQRAKGFEFIKNEKIDEFIVFFIEFAKKVMEREAKDNNYSQNIKRALEFIETNYKMNIKLEDCAYVIGLNPSYLSRIFHTEVKEPFINQLNMVRVREAKKLIRQGVSLKEVAYECGFKNYNYFFKVFKKITSFTPQQYSENLNIQ